MFDRLQIKARDAPEQIDAIRRRVKDAPRARQVSTRADTTQDRWSIAVGVEEHMSNGANRPSRVRERRPDSMAFTLTKIMLYFQAFIALSHRWNGGL
jgi:hypothetical protein